MELTDLPHYEVKAVHTDYCTGRFDAAPWVRERRIAGLFLGHARFLWGRFRKVNAAARTCSFYPDQPAELSSLRPGESYPFMDVYWGKLAELVLAEDRHWQRTRFEPCDMVRSPAEGGGWIATRLTPETTSGGEIVPEGWDHEHCEFCQKTIGAGGEAEGFLSPPKSWVCEECHASFVVPHSLAFVIQD